MPMVMDLAFYYDATSGKVTIPEISPIGTEVFGKDLLCVPSETIESFSSINHKEHPIYTFRGLIFPLQGWQTHCWRFLLKHSFNSEKCSDFFY